MVVRKANIQDVENIKKLWLESIKFHTRFDKNVYSAISEKDIKNQENIFRDAIKHKDKVIFIAEYNRNIIGYIWVISKNPKGIIADLIVSKNYRRKKIGNNLLKDAISYLKRRKCTSVQVNVFDKNLAALSLYSKFGFKKHISIIQKNLKS